MEINFCCPLSWATKNTFNYFSHFNVFTFLLLFTIIIITKMSALQNDRITYKQKTGPERIRSQSGNLHLF